MADTTGAPQPVDGAQAEASPLIHLPAEVLDNIFMWLEPAHLVTASRVNRLFYSLIKGNQSLCRNVYLLRMDKPADMGLDWEAALLDIVRLERIFDPKHDPEKDAQRLSFVCNAVCRLLTNASYTNNNPRDDAISQNVSLLNRLFSHDLAPNTFLHQSSLFERMRNTAWISSRHAQQPREEHQMSAKLHCLFGKPAIHAGKTRSTRCYPYACSRVYDLRQYTERTKWGPFRDDDTGRVDWEKVEAINIVLGQNVMGKWPQGEIFDDIWAKPFFGSFPRSYLPMNLPELGDLDARDPYGVTGAWYRIVCFLDYSDFFHYNFSMNGLVPTNVPRPPLHVGEATRLIIMNIRVTSIEPPGPDDGQALPVVRWEGESRSIDHSMDDNANSAIYGSTRLTKEGEVRWTSVSVIEEHQRWKSEGIQVGGVQSARGVIGTWFDSEYDIHGPCGPTVFWKAADSQNPREALLEGVRGGFSDANWPLGVGVDMQSSEDELNLMADDDDDDDWDADLEPISDELPGLLHDAEMDLTEFVGHIQQDHGQEG